jgi:poly(hydroxyalkanoate) granule-associated protein
MVKKLQKMAQKKSASPAGLLDSQIAQTVKDSAQQIWLAGLGAFAKAQEEGNKVFEALVKEGVSLQRKTQSVAEERIGDMTGKMSTLAEGVSAKAGQHWDKLESIFEDRVARALNRLGVPAHKDVAELNARIDALSAQVAKLGKGGAKTRGAKPVEAKAAKAPRAAKKATRSAAKKANGATKPATRRAAARKSAVVEAPAAAE